ncbi:MAG: CDP-alcohol phosphatidyltransferase family protein [Gemmatimonadota bacterium]|nr:CDP-alcohol phosphatidyltransferase family protein [Gemmatimonadota bacterium]
MNVPNVISLSRVALAVAFVFIDHAVARIVLIAVAALTDFLDGLVARLSDQRSVVGALLDPIADRVFVLAAISAYLVGGQLGVGQYFIFISRDIATAIGFIVARIVPWLRAVPFQARLLGKAVTVLQLSTLIAVLIKPAATAGLIVAIGVLSAMSIFDYTLALWRSSRD